MQDIIENIPDDEETPFDNDVSFEGSISESESDGEEGNEEYKQIPRKNEANYHDLEMQEDE